ncbi:MAG TPA: hypothetical protein VGM37_10465 [Armatimonadota bacterium]|jgi:hypothetical protein
MKVTLKQGERHIPLDGGVVVVFVAGVPVEVPERERTRFAEDPAFSVEPLPKASRKDGEAV